MAKFKVGDTVINKTSKEIGKIVKITNPLCAPLCSIHVNILGSKTVRIFHFTAFEHFKISGEELEKTLNKFSIITYEFVKDFQIFRARKKFFIKRYEDYSQEIKNGVIIYPNTYCYFHKNDLVAVKI